MNFIFKKGYLLVTIISTIFLTISCWDDDKDTGITAPTNNAPKWSKVSYQDSCERGDSLIIDLEGLAVDLDEDSLLFSLESVSAYSTISNGFLKINAPIDTTVKYDTTKIIVSDRSLTDTTTFITKFFGTVITNSAPKWNDTIFSYTVTKGKDSTFDLSLISSDPDLGSTLTYSIVDDTSAIDTIVGSLYKINADSNTISPYKVKIQVSDGVKSDTATFIFTLQEPNNAPVFTTDKPKDLYEIEEGDSIEFLVEATDADSDDTVTLSIDSLGSLPNKDSVSFVNELFKWKSSVGTSGSYVISLKATDGEDITTKPVTIKVGEANIIPTITVTDSFSNGLATVNESESIKVDFLFSDLDQNSKLNVTPIIPNVDGLTFTFGLDSATAELNYTPSYNTVINADSVIIDTIKISVSDGEDTSTYSLIITVKNVNRAPVFGTNSPSEFYSKTVGETLKIPFSATDADTEDVVIITVDTTTFKAGANISVVNDTIVWITAIADIGPDTISLSATDGEDITPIKVAVNVNEDITAPTITIAGINDGDTLKITETDSTGFTVTATPAVVGDNVTMSLVGTLPSTASFDSTTGNFSFKGTYDMASLSAPDGIYAYKITAQGSGSQAAVAEFSVYVKVSNVNRAPEFTIVPNDTTITIHENYSDELSFSDPDGDNVAITLSPSPAMPQNLTFNSSNNTITGLIDRASFTAGDSFNIVVKISDGADSSVSNWILKVKTREWILQSTDAEIVDYAAKDMNTIYKINRNAEDTVKFYSSTDGGKAWGSTPLYSEWCETYSNTSYKTTSIFDLNYCNDSLYYQYSVTAGNTGPPGITKILYGMSANGSNSPTSSGGGGAKFFYYISKSTNIRYSAVYEYNPMGIAGSYIAENSTVKFDSDSNGVNSIDGYNSESFESVWVSFSKNGIVRKIGSSGSWVPVHSTSFAGIFATQKDSNVIFLLDADNNLHKSINALESGTINISQVVSVNNVAYVKMINENVGWLLDTNGGVYFTNNGFSTKVKENTKVGASPVIIEDLISATNDGHLFAVGQGGEIFRY